MVTVETSEMVKGEERKKVKWWRVPLDIVVKKVSIKSRLNQARYPSCVFDKSSLKNITVK